MEGPDDSIAIQDRLELTWDRSETSTDVYGTSCLKPFCPPDRWDDADSNGIWTPDDEYDDVNGNGVWDPGEPLTEDWNGNGVWDPAEFYDPEITGYKMPDDVGAQMTLQYLSSNHDFRAGWYYPVRFPPINSGEPWNPGAADYEMWIVGDTCEPYIVSIGDSLALEVGNMVGPTVHALDLLIAKDPTAEWDPATGTVINSAYPVSPRIMKVAAFDPTRGVQSGPPKHVVVSKLMVLFLEFHDRADMFLRFIETLPQDPDVDIFAGPDQSGRATTDVSVEFYVINTGGLPDTFSITAVDSLGWNIDPSSYEVALDSDQLDSVSFTVTIPNVPIGTTNRVFVTAISQTDSSAWDSTSLTVTCDDFIEGVEVTAGSDQSGYADSIVSVAFLVKNVGVVPDSYSLDISDIQGWDIVPLHYDLTLDTAEVDTVAFTVGIPYVPLSTTDELTLFVVSKTNSLASDSATLTVTCSAYKESLEVTAGGDQSGYADSIVSVSFFIQNVGVVIDSYSIDISDAEGWDIVPLHYNIVLDTAETNSAIFTVSIPLVSPGTSDNLTLIATSKSNYLISDSATLTVTCSAYKESVQVEAGSDQSGYADSSVSVTFFIENAGVVIDSYSVDISGVQGWEISPPHYDLVLDTAEIDSAIFTVGIPLVSPGTSDSLTLFVISKSNDLVRDSAALIVTCSSYKESLEVTAGGDQDGYADSIVSVSFLIQNVGVVIDSYSLDVSDTRGWNINPAHYDLVLDTAEIDSAIFTLSIPLVSPGTADSVTLLAISKSNYLVRDSAALVVTCSAYKESVQVTAGDDQNGYADSIVSVSFLIQNVGVVTDSYSIDISDVQGWEIVPPHYDLVLDASETQPVGFTVAIPYVALGTADILTLIATSKTNPIILDSASLIVVCSSYVEGLSLDPGSDINATANTQIEAPFHIHNTGLAPDSFNLTLTDSLGWDIQPAAYQLIMDAGQEDTIVFDILIPITPIGTTNTLFLTGESLTNPFIADSGSVLLVCTSRILRVPADFGTIQAAIDFSSDWDSILVASGTYYEHIIFNGKVVVVKSEKGADSTILSMLAGGVSMVSFISGEDSNSVLDGFTITGAFLEVGQGAGIRCQNSSPKIVNNRIVDNSCPYGAGIDCDNYSSPIIANNVIEQNPAMSSGGGIRCNNHSSPVIRENLIIGNSAVESGAGIWCEDNCWPTIVGNLIAHNTAETGYGGGIGLLNSSVADIINNTIDANSASTGGGIYIGATSSATIQNTIVTNTTSGKGVRYDGASPIFLYYCDVWSNLDQDYYGCLPGDGCISADPVYCDPNNGAYSLWARSPCLGTGLEGADIGAFGEGCSGVGDANGDGEVNIGDVVYLVSYLYKAGPAPVPVPAGDVNCDGLINVGDIVYLVNYLFKGGPPPCEP